MPESRSFEFHRERSDKPEKIRYMAFDTAVPRHPNDR